MSSKHSVMVTGFSSEFPPRMRKPNPFFPRLSVTVMSMYSGLKKGKKSWHNASN